MSTNTAPCTTKDPDAMLPGSDPVGIESARMVCTTCPFEVWAACLERALTAVPKAGIQGIWAGTTATQRERLRKQQNAGTLPPMKVLHGQFLATV